MSKFFIYHFGYITKLERIKPMEPKMGAYANHTHSKHPQHKLSQQNLHDSVK